MKERAGDVASSRARRRGGRAVGVATNGERFVATARSDRRIMELMAAIGRALRPERTGGRDPRLAIAERHAALGEAHLDAEEACHPMDGAGSVGEAFAQ